MMYKAKVAVCSDIRTKHSTQSEGHVEFLNVKPGGTYRTARLLKVKWNLPKQRQPTSGPCLQPLYSIPNSQIWILSSRIRAGLSDYLFAYLPLLKFCIYYCSLPYVAQGPPILLSYLFS